MALKAGTKGSETTERPVKDRWDKLDIIAKALIPVIVALSVLLWNNAKTSRDTAAQMITIATSILTAPPENSTPSALRQWAIAVLQTPSDPPALSDEAALALTKESIPWVQDWETMRSIFNGNPQSGAEPSTSPWPAP